MSRDHSIPIVRLSSRSLTLNPSEFNENLRRFVQIFNDEYVEKQKKVRQEVENKERYLMGCQRTHMKKSEEIQARIDQIRSSFISLISRHEQVSRDGTSVRST